MTWTLPPIEALARGTSAPHDPAEHARLSKTIERTLGTFDVRAAVVGVTPGPRVTRYELRPGEGVKVARIESLADDLALALAARAVRIIAPVPGTSVVGIEIPNATGAIVTLRDIAETLAFRDAPSPLAVALGRDVAGVPVVTDLARLPHVLVAGQTGSGKSVLVNAFICSLLIRSTPDTVRLILADPKRVELAAFAGVPHLAQPIATEPTEILRALSWSLIEMERRYRLFQVAGARNIGAFNLAGTEDLPYVVVVIDELADLMMTAPKAVESAVTRLAQLARATGIHLVVATQRPSVDVITGLLKANIPARIAFAVASAVDSRTILDASGAETLLGHGDMLYLPSDSPSPIRVQGAYASDQDIATIADHWRAQVTPASPPDPVRTETRTSPVIDARYENALAIVKRAGWTSQSQLARDMGLSIVDAGALIDRMLDAGALTIPQDGRRGYDLT